MWPPLGEFDPRRSPSGAVAQLGERCFRTAEARGSTPLSSTNDGPTACTAVRVSCSGAVAVGAGVVAQQGERLSGRQKVAGSIPADSTREGIRPDEELASKASSGIESVGGSSPSPSASTLAVQSGVDAALSARRSWVQIPSGVLGHPRGLQGYLPSVGQARWRLVNPPRYAGRVFTAARGVANAEEWVRLPLPARSRRTGVQIPPGRREGVCSSVWSERRRWKERELASRAPC